MSFLFNINDISISRTHNVLCRFTRRTTRNPVALFCPTPGAGTSTMHWWWSLDNGTSLICSSRTRKLGNSWQLWPFPCIMIVWRLLRNIANVRMVVIHNTYLTNSIYRPFCINKIFTEIYSINYQQSWVIIAGSLLHFREIFSHLCYCYSFKLYRTSIRQS